MDHRFEKSSARRNTAALATASAPTTEIRLGQERAAAELLRPRRHEVGQRRPGAAQLGVHEIAQRLLSRTAACRCASGR